MKITFHGAARTVTGSQHLLQVNGLKILLDCGLYQGKRSESDTRNRTFKFDPKTLDLVILSHAHTDHAGNLPNLVKQGYRGSIVCTHATRDLCGAMLLDSGRIQERDVEFVNKRNKQQGKPLIEPLYTEKDARTSLRYFESIAYYKPRSLGHGITLTFYDAGHMLGSAIVVLDIEDSSSGYPRRFVFSGDIGRKGIPIIRDPDMLDEDLPIHTLILESTYGNRLHDTYADGEKALERIVNETYRRGGSLVMPSFAVGRAQQLVYSLNKLAEAGDIPQLPVFVDSPLAVDVTAAFRMHPECYDEETEALLESDNDVFGFRGLQYTRTAEESKRLNFMREPAIIISPSGMLEHGRVLHHLRNRISDPRNTVLITGWQAEHTLGRKLIDGAAAAKQQGANAKPQIVRIFGEEHEVKAHIEVLNGFSGHGDYNELTDWVRAFKHTPKRTFLVHGELEAAEAFAKHLGQHAHHHVEIPDMHQEFEV
jgi:metallo-beta-lactamase family protein